MAKKLLGYGVDYSLILWIVEFLVNRKQCVRFQSASSSSLGTSTGAPQGTVLAPELFTLYTNNCRGTNITPFIKYSDDTALVDLSDDDTSYFDEVTRFTGWCKENYLDLCWFVFNCRENGHSLATKHSRMHLISPTAILCLDKHFFL